jgi:hypothetical protein
VAGTLDAFDGGLKAGGAEGGRNGRRRAWL